MPPPVTTEAGSAGATPTSSDAGPRSGTAFAVTTDGLTKRFRGGQFAVRDLGLRVPSGSVYGFLGPNGSGKTTTIRMLLGLVRPTAGEVRLLGHEMPDGAAHAVPRVGAPVQG